MLFLLFINFMSLTHSHTYPRKRRKQEVHEHGNLNFRIFDGSNPNLIYFVCQFPGDLVAIIMKKPYVILN
jgi:hypothetical protein